jgi:signal transduction histidine kinase
MSRATPPASSSFAASGSRSSASSSRIETRQHRLEVDCDHALVDGDPVRLVQVFTNLLTNAARYTPEGGTITVTARSEPGEVVIRVADTGRGISAAILPKIFEMFVQERTATDGSGGLGLGLGLVKRLVELHGGSVRAWSPGEGKGSTFEVRLARIPEP